ncbi:MAG: Fe-S cluster assembly protein IscX, partial [Candidatus Thioglobus sp.]|nr:Fe-S cluster assembly protein IscX [Candidatus Thioglobus sp.]MBT4553440.1 Fe-S cluster assembly protein IscX [Candidatus Thioglobus sp.]
MTWIDSIDIAIALDEAHPDFDPTFVNFVDLRKMVVA